MGGLRDVGQLGNVGIGGRSWHRCMEQLSDVGIDHDVGQFSNVGFVGHVGLERDVGFGRHAGLQRHVGLIRHVGLECDVGFVGYVGKQRSRRGRKLSFFWPSDGPGM